MINWRASDLMRRLHLRWVRRYRTREKVLYITFDDGPIPEITPWVLDRLKEYGAKATFFCIGRNVEANPELHQRIIAEGHGVGNHTYDHWSGWETPRRTYLLNTMRCQQLTRTKLFRPPYGRITLGQARALGRRFQIVFWDVLAGDFDVRVSGQQVLQHVLGRSRPGSIIVFHDNLLSEERMRHAFPRVLQHFGALGYRFPVLPGSTTG